MLARQHNLCLLHTIKKSLKQSQTLNQLHTSSHHRTSDTMSRHNGIQLQGFLQTIHQQLSLMLSSVVSRAMLVGDVPMYSALVLRGLLQSHRKYGTGNDMGLP